MANKTTQSIASNMIDPTNYIQGGGIENGKLGFENRKSKNWQFPISHGCGIH